MKKRILALVLLVSLLGTVLCGCGGSSKEQAEETRASANELVVGIAQDLDDSLDPHKAVAAGTKEVMFNVFEGLMKISPDGSLIPAVAEKYTISDDGLTYTFTLREGIKFHNGDAVTAEDVLYSIERCAAASETGIVQVAALSAIAGMEAPDEGTVVITLSEPNNEFLVYLTLAVLPADYTEQDTKPVGTGPFKFISRAAQDSIVMEKNEAYWGTPAKLDKVTFKIFENADSIIMSMQSGAVDLFSHLTSTQTDQLGKEFYVVEGSMNLVQALYLNHAEKPFDDPRVCEALCYAVDKHQIIDLAFDGYGLPIGSSVYPSFGKYFEEDLVDYYKPDVEKAKALLSEAGYPNGFSMTITVPSNYQPHIDTAQVIVEQLKAVGITAEVQLVEWGTWLSDVYAGRQFQSTITGLTASTMTARYLLERFTTGHVNNFVNYSNPEYDALFQEAQAAKDDAAQTAVYKEMLAHLTENAVNVYIQDLADLIAVRQGVEGLELYPTYVLDLSTVGYV